MMKNKKLFIIFISASFITPHPFYNCSACSMVKITKNGKTIVGNNEDSSNPNARIWFEPGKDGHYGAVYVGFDNLFPQGGMNEAGLVFDGFTQSKRAVTDTLGKKKISASDLSKLLMQKCSTVEEVESLVSQYNISFWSSGLLRFVDRTGTYLYVDGDSLIIGQNDWFVQTNKRPYEKKECWRSDKANKLLNTYYDSTIEYCKSIMDSIHQEANWGGTLYTTIYDLQNTTIYLYYLFDYEHVVIFNLKEELKKGENVLNMPELFHHNKKGLRYYNEYNKLLSLLDHLGDSSVLNESERISTIKNSIDTSFILKYIWVTKISGYGDFYLGKKDYEKAIRYFKLNVALFPDLWYVFDNLGATYMENRQYKLAFENYSHSIEMNPKNTSSKNQIEKLKELIDK